MSENLVSSRLRNIGESHAEVGAFSYGLWRFTNPDTKQQQMLIETALDAGLNLIDAADVYGFDWGGTGFGSVEVSLGRVLSQAPRLRGRMVLATKGGIVPPLPYDSSATALRSACEASLNRLGVERIDLYFIHRPDLFTHPSEVAATLSTLRSEGKIREVGVSNHTPAQVAVLQSYLDFPIAANQFEYSVLALAALRDGTFDQAMQHGLTPMAWSPLAGGRLATAGGLKPELRLTLQRLAVREGVDVPTVALAFILAHPSAPICVIGSQNAARIAASPAAFDVELDRNDVYDIIQASEGVALP